MFKDIKGRQLKVGDLVLYNLGSLSSKYCYGLIYSDSKVITYSGGIQEIRKDNFCYLIANPDDYEISIKCEIAENFALRYGNKLKENTSNSKLLSNYSMGDVLMDSENYYLYLGFISLSDSNNQYHFSGHGYILIPSPHFKDTSSLLSYLNNRFTNSYLTLESPSIESPSSILGDRDGCYDLKLLKRKSTRYHKVYSSHNISSLNGSILTACMEENLYPSIDSFGHLYSIDLKLSLEV